MTSINYADAAVIVILVLFSLRCRRKGITYFAVSIVGKVISIFLSVTLYGHVSKILRETPVFPFINERVSMFVDAETASYISGFSEHLMANDNNEVYKLFRVETFSDYVSSYITNIALNIIALMLVYICVSMAIGLLFKAHGIFSSLPLISHVNSVTGLIAGLIEGVIFIWIAVIFLMFFVVQGQFANIYETLLSSKLAIYFLEYNAFALAMFKISA